MKGKSLSAALCAVLLLSCGGGGEGDVRPGHADSPAAAEGAAEGTTPADLTRKAREYADSVMAELTLEQRVGQCFMPAIYASGDAATMRRLRSYMADLHVGGVVLLKGDLESAARMAREGREGCVPLFMAIDAEWGLGMRLRDAPDFPRNGKISPHADEELLFDYGGEVARECRRVGINMVLGPVIDVAENPRGVIGSRSFGSDPKRVADLGVAYARGLESGRVISVAKHFPGHGSPKGDSHRSVQVISRSLHELDSVDLYPFRSYVDAGLSGVMVGHLAVPAVDPLQLPAAVSEAVIADLLRGDLGFSGLVLTDALNMGGAEGHGASAALLAGADIVVAPRHTGSEIREIVRMVEQGEMAGDVVDEHCRRILFYKYLVAATSGEGEVRLEGLREDVKGNADSLSRRLSEL